MDNRRHKACVHQTGQPLSDDMSVEVTVSLGCSNHKKVDLKIMRGWRKSKKQNYYPQLQQSRFGLTQGSAGENPMREEGSRTAGCFLSSSLSKLSNSYVQEARQARKNWNTKKKHRGSGSTVRSARKTVETLSAWAGMMLGKSKLSWCWTWS